MDSNQANKDMEITEQRKQEFLTKFHPTHLRSWVYQERKRIQLLRNWVAEAAMDAAGLSVSGKNWTVIDHEQKVIVQ